MVYVGWKRSFHPTYTIISASDFPFSTLSFKRIESQLNIEQLFEHTSTMAFFRSGLPVGYVPIKASNRTGERKSHIRLFHDGLRFLIIILKIGALFSPMRFFLPVSAVLFIAGMGYYGYTYFAWGRLTNMTTILFLSSLFTFLIGIVSEQVSALHYKDIQETRRVTVRKD